MTLAMLGIALGCFAAGGAAACVFARRPVLSLYAGTVGVVVGALVGITASVIALVVGEHDDIRLPWSVPVGELHLGIDPLSSFFLLTIFTVCGLSALYAAAYLRPETERRSVARAVFAFAALAIAMAGVVMARDGVVFLFAWEIMTIASFVLVAFEHHREEVSRASLVYLVTSHVGTAFLFLLFTLLAARAGSFDFAAFAELELSPRWASACFVAALVGFGTKAGLWPLHAWLPQAHPAAPSHVSAVMSGVMIEIGLYGLVRTLGFLGTPAVWWGPLLLVVGAASALLGVLGALGAADLKRLLAYSSIENVGIVTLAIGLGLVLGRAGNASLAALAFSAALFHVWNHALFKSVLFQGAGAVLHAAHTRDLDGLGGLARRMPRVAAPFLAAALAASALPPLNGFASEWVLYVTAFQSAIAGVGSGASLAILPLLALVGGLAAAAFVRAFGIAFLGEPRSAAARTATDAPPLLALPMWIGAVLCLACGIAPGFFFRIAASAALEIVPAAGPLPMVAGLTEIGGALAVLAAIVAAVALFRAALLRDRAPRRALTWDCGYALPTARMQYTASSFAEPALDPFAPLLRSHIAAAHPEGYFPLEARYEEHVEEGGAGFPARLAQATAGALSRVTVLQLGRLQFYLLYILLTLLSLLAWWMPR